MNFDLVLLLSVGNNTFFSHREGFCPTRAWSFLFQCLLAKIVGAISSICSSRLNCWILICFTKCEYSSCSFNADMALISLPRYDAVTKDCRQLVVVLVFVIGLCSRKIGD